MDVLCDAIGFSLPLTPTQAQSPSQSGSQHSATPQTRPTHRCHLCNRTYERADHLNRHLKSHENARPHKCSRCSKCFNRADLLNRHEQSHDRQAGESHRPRVEKGERVTTACLACVASKVKCQESKPCVRCLKRGIVCETTTGYLQNSSDSTSMDGSRDGPGVSESSVSGKHGLNQVTEFRGNPQIRQHWPNETHKGSSGLHTDLEVDKGPKPNMSMYPDTQEITRRSSILDGIVDRDIGTVRPSYHSGGEMNNNGNNLFDETFRDLAYLPGDSQFSDGLGFTPRDSYFSQDLDFGMWDIDLDSVELAYQHADNVIVEQQTLHHPANHGHGIQKDVSKRYAAFERSPWLWTPTQKDQALNEHNALSVDEQSIHSVLAPDSPAATLDEFVHCCIDIRMRDQMLGLIFTLQKGSKQVPSFPSLDLLNSIIKVYFVQQRLRVDHLIHAGTFDPNKTLPHLLLAIISAGSTVISTPVIWKMGLALQEVVRCALADFFEQDNSNTRNLQALQAYVIGLDVGLWSGFKRKMEIAESFAQPVITMLRRVGAFAAPRNTSHLIPERNDSDAVNNSKWKKWVERESFKRLVLHLFMHDIHASVGLQKPPLMSFTELKFALPASRELWLAKSASSWRDIHLSNPSYSDPTSFIDAMHNPDLLSNLPPQVDPQLCTMSILHGFWGQIWSVLESKKFYPPSKTTHRLCLLTSHTELYREFSSFSTLLPSLTRNSLDSILITELFMMIMHAAPEDLQRFAGKSGEQEARAASAEFQDWARGKESRMAIWHAGQVFHVAQRLGQAQLRGFNAIAVYFAALTLWIYGIMISGLRPPTSGSEQSSQIILNATESAKIRSWRSNDDGARVAGLNVSVREGQSEFIPLNATDRVLGLARQLYRDNFPVLEEPLPPLVENLSNLLRDLGSLPGSRVSRAASESAG